MIADRPSRMGPTEVACAVFCGANTAERLSREWSIPVDLAGSLLIGAMDAGLLLRLSGERFHALQDEPAPVRIQLPPVLRRRQSSLRLRIANAKRGRDAAGRFRAA